MNSQMEFSAFIAWPGPIFYETLEEICLAWVTLDEIMFRDYPDTFPLPLPPRSPQPYVNLHYFPESP